MSGLAAPPSSPRKPSIRPRTQRAPTSRNNEAEAPQDPNLTNPRLLLNGVCIYERQLPGNASITAHVQRLQHGFYATPAVSDQDYDHVDFLGINFVFHSPNTLTHRFKAATIRASVRNQSAHQLGCSQQHYPRRHPPDNPRFLMHAPHLIYGTVSPETLQWNYSLTGSLGVAELPLMASVSPAGGMNGRYRRYEMMRIQGSARTLESPRGRNLDVDAGEIVWSLEENNLQRSGLPREFTFAMLVRKPRADSRLVFALDIEPTLQSWCGSYPAWWLSLPQYRPQPRRAVEFRVEVGQRFGPVISRRGFNFASLASSFDDYVRMPGKRFSYSIPSDGGLLQDVIDPRIVDHDHDHDHEYTTIKPYHDMPRFTYPEHSCSFVDPTIVQTQTRTQAQIPPAAATKTPTHAHTPSPSGPDTGPHPHLNSRSQPQSRTLNLRVHLDRTTSSRKHRPASISTPTATRAPPNPSPSPGSRVHVRSSTGTSMKAHRDTQEPVPVAQRCVPLRRTKSREWPKAGAEGTTSRRRSFNREGRGEVFH